MPVAQMSASYPEYSFFKIISGNIYEGVPQKTLSLSLQLVANPKSIILTCLAAKL
jgi:hypothetical protein